MNILDINRAIMFGTWTDTELTSINDAVKWNRAQLARQTRRSITIGSSVQFTDPRSGRVHQGTVNKIKIKNVLINCPTFGRGGLVNVPANMLEAV